MQFKFIIRTYFKMEDNEHKIPPIFFQFFEFENFKLDNKRKFSKKIIIDLVACIEIDHNKYLTSMLSSAYIIIKPHVLLSSDS